MHELVKRNRHVKLAKILSQQTQFDLEPRKRSAETLHGILTMVTEFHMLINHITVSKQTFFPKVNMADLA